jgi:hypothetical protein
MNFFRHHHEALGNNNAITQLNSREHLTSVETPTTLRHPTTDGAEINPEGSPPNRGAAKERPTQAGFNSRYSASRTHHHVDFFCHAPDASQVSLVGDFNGWNATATPMIRMPDGCWMTGLELPHGHHQYVFLVDGRPVLDPKAMGRTRNDRNEPVSLIAVS